MHAMLRCVALVLLSSTAAIAAEPVFSGPQATERLPPFVAQRASGERVSVGGWEADAASPVLIVFVHQVTRPSIALARLLMEFAATKSPEGLESRLVFLTDDVTDTVAFLSRAQQAMPRGAVPLISPDGIEGPGAYGLNRNVTLTVLVGRGGVVTANFALVQPSVQADAAKIGHEIVKALGGHDAPTLEEMGYQPPQPAMRGDANAAEQDAVYRQMMAPVIQKAATPDEVVAAAAAVEAYAAKNPWFQRRVHDASRRIVESPRLADYGTPQAQEYLKKWAKDIAPAADGAATREQGEPAREPPARGR